MRLFFQTTNIRPSFYATTAVSNTICCRLTISAPSFPPSKSFTKTSSVGPHRYRCRFSPYWNNHKPLLLVIVIGETARAQNFSLGGYPRDTNRDLEPWRNQLLYFGDTSACGTSTAVSLPCIFSAQRRRTFKPGSEAYTENLLDVFQRVGYRVLWRENNSGCKNNCDRVKTETFCSNYACKDEILLKDFIPTVKSLPGNTVIVLHQQGSHGPAYHRRYPDHFKRYTPVCTTADLSRCLQNEIINAYDNSIAYTSYVLAQTISLLSRLSADYNTLMLFVSDHGESLGEKGSICTPPLTSLRPANKQRYRC